jgi:hypothetical protein
VNLREHGATSAPDLVPAEEAATVDPMALQGDGIETRDPGSGAGAMAGGTIPVIGGPRQQPERGSCGPIERYALPLAKGALAGTVATVAMSGLMFAAKKARLMGEMPPEKITGRSLDRLGMAHGRRFQDATAAAAHIGFGAAAGTLLGLISLRFNPPLPPLLQGLLFGTAVWVTSYQGWLPAAGLMPRPKHDQPGRPPSMLAAHWIYGATAALLLERFGTGNRPGPAR